MILRARIGGELLLKDCHRPGTAYNVLGQGVWWLRQSTAAQDIREAPIGAQFRIGHRPSGESAWRFCRHRDFSASKRAVQVARRA